MAEDRHTRVEMMESEMKKWCSGIRRCELETGARWPRERARERAAGVQ
jgi:hypothetical protein